ncbi:MAG: LEPR-XLL domain-containing protein, partial [Candidatus Anstonellales archaeon]
MSLERSFRRQKSYFQKLYEPFRIKNYEQNGEPKRKIPQMSNKFHLEPLEPRVLLSADSVLPGITQSLTDGLTSFVNKVQGLDFQTSIPGILQVYQDVNKDGKLGQDDVYVPSEVVIKVDQNEDGTIPYTSVNKEKWDEVYAYINEGTHTEEQKLNAMDLNNDRVVDWGEVYKTLFIGGVIDFLENYDESGKTIDNLENDLYGFLITLHEPISLTGVMDFYLLGVSSESTTDLFGHSFNLYLTLEDRYMIDLGLEADQKEISLPYKEWTASGVQIDVNRKPEIVVSQTITMPFAYNFNVKDITGANPLTKEDFSFAVEKINFSIDSDESPVSDLIVNVGFLGTTTYPSDPATISLNMDYDIDVIDPSSPRNLGFVDEDSSLIIFKATEDDGVLEALNEPRAFSFTNDIIFTLKTGAHDFEPVEVKITATMMEDNENIDDLRDDLQNALESAGFGDLIKAGVLDGKLTLSLPQTDATPLGFANEVYDNDEGDGKVVLIALNTPQGDGATAFEFTQDINFLLSIDGALPKLITIPATDPAIEDLKFAPYEKASLEPLVATNPGPTNGKFEETSGVDDKTITITITQTTGTTTKGDITITEAVWSGNNSLGDLINEINSAIASSSLNGLVTAEIEGDKIKLTPASSVTSVKVTGANVTEFGFTDGQANYLSLSTDADATTSLTGTATFDVIITPVVGFPSAVTVTVPEGTDGIENYINEINNDLAGSGIEAIADGNRITLRVM